jgi:hypothetical protein
MVAVAGAAEAGVLDVIASMEGDVLALVDASGFTASVGGEAIRLGSAAVVHEPGV